MPFFAEETLQAVRDIPLYEIVRPQVELSRSGRNWKGLSPFSNEKTPSFFVLTEKNFFKCHSSGLAGDGIRFVQETEKLTFPEAVEALAERFNIPIQYAGGTAPDPEARSLKQALLDIHDYARDYYHQALMADQPAAAQVRRYWVEERGFSLDLAREFQIGYAPADNRELLDRLVRKGFSRTALAACGLFHAGPAQSDPAGWPFAFRGRLMIPIRDLQGQVVAFTARQLELTPRDHPSWQAKYLNSPETPVFHKGRLLFNLDRAKEGVKTAGRLLLVEGQLDALRCWESGFHEALAPQGTSVTPEQVRLMKRYTDQLDVLLDGDEAGARAALRLIPLAFGASLEVRIISLPAGQDPDGFLRAHGRAALAALPRQEAIAFAAAALLGSEPPTPEQRGKALQGLFEIISACPSAVVREGHLNQAVEATGASPAAALADYQRFLQTRGPARPASARPPAPVRAANPSPTLTNLEGDLIWTILQNAGWADSLAQVVDQQWIKHETSEGRVLSRILAHALVDHVPDSRDLLLLMESDDERACLSRYIVDERTVPDLEAFVNTTLASLIRRFCRDRIREIDQKITQHAQPEPQSGTLRTLLEERRELTRHLHSGAFVRVSLTP